MKPLGRHEPCENPKFKKSYGYRVHNEKGKKRRPETNLCGNSFTTFLNQSTNDPTNESCQMSANEKTAACLNFIHNLESVNPNLVTAKQTALLMADQFTVPAVAASLKNENLPQLRKVVSQMTLKTNMSAEKIVGISMAMILLGGEALSALSPFLGNVERMSISANN